MATLVSALCLPDNIVLEIFKNLSIKELSVAASICKKWYDLSKDKSLRKRLDLSQNPLPLQKLWKVTRLYANAHTNSIYIKGFMGTAMKWKSDSLSDAYLTFISLTCPDLKIFSIQHGNLKNTTGPNLPSSLETLHLTYCFIPVEDQKWFQKLGDPTCMPKLKHLDLSLSSQISNKELLILKNRTGLKSLKLNLCYRISETGLGYIAENLVELEVLEIDKTAACTDLNLHQISRNLKKLRRLIVGDNSKLTDKGLAVLPLLKRLETLCIGKCKSLQEESLRVMSRVKWMKELILWEDISDGIVDELKQCLPECVITRGRVLWAEHHV